MSAVNQILLVGRVEALPFYHTTEKAAADLTKFILITENESSGLSDSKGEEKHECLAWGAAALLLHQHLRKGSQLAVKGSLHYHLFNAKDGTQVVKPEITITDFSFLDGC